MARLGLDIPEYDPVFDPVKQVENPTLDISFFLIHISASGEEEAVSQRDIRRLDPGCRIGGRSAKGNEPSSPKTGLYLKHLYPDRRTVTRRVPGRKEGGEEEEELAEAGGRGGGEVEEDAEAVGGRHCRGEG